MGLSSFGGIFGVGRMSRLDGVCRSFFCVLFT